MRDISRDIMIYLIISLLLICTFLIFRSYKVEGDLWGQIQTLQCSPGYVPSMQDVADEPQVVKDFVMRWNIEYNNLLLTNRGEQ